jgi:uncharacterized membrane protein YhdT
MISSQGTQVQRWSKSLSLTFLLIILAAHVALILVAVILCPELYQSERFQGGHCQTVPLITATSSGLPNNEDNHCEGCDSGDIAAERGGDSRCVSRGDGETVRLADILMSFRFPRQPQFSVWSWRSTSSLSLYIKILEKNLIVQNSDSDQLTAVNISQLTGSDRFHEAVQLSASLDYALNEYLEMESSLGVDTTSSAWHSRAIVRKVNRTLLCRHVELLPQSDPTPLTAAESELNFVCLLHPLFELAPLTNASYISSVHIEARDDIPDTESNDTYIKDINDNFSDPVIDLIHSNATIISYLTVVTEMEAFHEVRFYIKCLFTPLILMSLVWFMVRLCVHDLYISIPDRLLMTASLAQLLVNLPTELILAHLPMAHLILIDPVAEALLFTALGLFWLVFTLDKLADNEPWERTTRYYWRSIGLMVAFAALALLTVGYLEVPPFSNPFHNHWQPGSPTWVALGLIFGLAVAVAAYQSYLSVIVFRVICDISIQ